LGGGRESRGGVKRGGGGGGEVGGWQQGGASGDMRNLSVTEGCAEKHTKRHKNTKGGGGSQH